MDLGLDLLTNKKKIKTNIKSDIINYENIKNNEELYKFIKNKIIKSQKIQNDAFYKLSELQFLNIIQQSILEYQKYLEINNNKNKKNNIIEENKIIEENNIIEEKKNNIKNIKIISSKKNYEINNMKLNN